MKNFIYILTLLTIVGCGNSEKKDAHVFFDRLELVSESNIDLREEYEKSTVNDSLKTEANNCSGEIIDFLKLKDNGLQIDFFSKLDSIRKVQYPANDQETSIMFDLSPEYLNKFLVDIDIDSLSVKNQFEKEYHFNIAPLDFTDSEICKDKIAVSFDVKDCSFRLNIYNTFLVEPNWCTESMVVYGFKIKNDKVVDFWRQEAG